MLSPVLTNRTRSQGAPDVHTVVGVREAMLRALDAHRAAPAPTTPADIRDELLAREVRRLLGVPVPVIDGEAEAEGLRFSLGSGGLQVAWDCVHCHAPVKARPVLERHEVGQCFEDREKFCPWCAGRGRRP